MRLKHGLKPPRAIAWFTIRRRRVRRVVSAVSLGRFSRCSPVQGIFCNAVRTRTRPLHCIGHFDTELWMPMEYEILLRYCDYIVEEIWEICSVSRAPGCLPFRITDAASLRRVRFSCARCTLVLCMCNGDFKLINNLRIHWEKYIVTSTVLNDYLEEHILCRLFPMMNT